MLAAADAHAVYVYRFQTEQSAPAAGPVSGGFEVSDAAIADGQITADEIHSFSYSMQQATAPFARATFAPPDPLTISGGSITVDPATGELIGNGYDITIFNDLTGQTLELGCFGRLAPGEGGYTVQTAHGVLNDGVAACSVGHAITAAPAAAVPATGGASLLSLAALLVLIACWRLRRSAKAL
jgi:hypothetical protein